MEKNRYEIAFEKYLRAIRRPFLSNRQERRLLMEDGSTLKNFDDLVQHSNGENWIVDVKGRRFPSGLRSRRYWKNWTTRDDLFGLMRWEEILGAGSEAYRNKSAFVFAYEIVGERSPLPESRLFHDRGRRFAFFAVPVRTYMAEARLISPRWDTFETPTSRCRKIARPVDEFFADSSFF